MPTPALSAARMRRNLGVTTLKLANNSVTFDKIQQLEANKFLGRTSSGTGNPEQINQFLHMRVPGWTDGGYVTNFALLSAYLDGITRSNKNNVSGFNQSTQVTVNASFVNDKAAYEGGVLHPNGKIYMIPYDATLMATIDPVTDTVDFPITISSSYQVAAYLGGCVTPNGKIVPFNYFSSLVRIIDPANNTVKVIGTIGVDTTDNTLAGSYYGGALGPNGKVYLSPNPQLGSPPSATGKGGTVFYYIDPVAETVVGFATIQLNGTGTNSGGAPSSGRFIAGVDGNIYGGGGFYINPSNNTITTFSSSNGFSYPFVTLPNGKIMSSGSIFDPFTKTTTIINIPFNSTPFSGIFLPNGKVMFGPGYSTLVTIVDPENLSVTIVATVAAPVSTGGTTIPAWYGGILAPNGHVYHLPFGSTKFLKILCNFNNNFNNNVLTNQLTNKSWL